MTRDRREYSRRRYLANRQHFLEKSRQYRQTHPEWKKDYDKQYYDRNKQSFTEYRRRNIDRIRTNKRRQSHRLIKFQGKYILQKENPRKGKCVICGRIKGFEIKLTNMHHMLYDKTDPLKHTFEVCIRDHKRIHRGFE